MVTAMQNISKLSFYFDAMCPKSFTAFQILQRSPAFKEKHIEYKPIIRRKLLSRRENMENLELPTSLYTNLEQLRNLNGLSPVALRHVDHRTYAVGKATLFITAINRNYPHLAYPVVNELFSRFWLDDLDIGTAPSFLTISRNVGLEFRDSDNLVSRLEERSNVDAMNKCLQESLDAQQSDTPWLEFYNIEGERVDTITELSTLAHDLQNPE
uniref:DSBA domain-containing protein n=1 Tax=Steinernema glaseri TaxID=37863 RepID=A0A1I8AVS4_9BILA